MTWLLVVVLEISAAMAIGFVLGRIWQTRHDLEQERARRFTQLPIAPIPHPTDQTEPHAEKLFWGVD